MHDCEQEFYIHVECHFDEAMFLVNDEIRKRDTYFPGVEMLEEAVWHISRKIVPKIKQKSITIVDHSLNNEKPSETLKDHITKSQTVKSNQIVIVIFRTHFSFPEEIFFHMGSSDIVGPKN
jgi:hypothetical protein